MLLSFTPCVLPMIPILSGIIVGQGGTVTPARGFSLAFTYVQGMALDLRRCRRGVRARVQTSATGVLPAAVDHHA